MLINFTETFINDGDIKDLWREFTTEKEMSGILNLAIEGVKRLRDNQKFTKDSSAEEVENHYIRNSDPVAAFFMDNVEISNDAGDYVSLQTMHAAFVAYCRNYRFRDTSLRKFNSSIRKNFRLKESREINNETGKQDRVWTGVFLSSTSTNISFPLDKTEKTEMTKDQVSNLGSNKSKNKTLSYGNCHSSHSVTGLNTMEYIQKKVSEYGGESDHAYNVIIALLEKQGIAVDEIEYCINLHKQGHRVYIPPKE